MNCPTTVKLASELAGPSRLEQNLVPSTFRTGPQPEQTMGEEMHEIFTPPQVKLLRLLHGDTLVNKITEKLRGDV